MTIATHNKEQFDSLLLDASKVYAELSGKDVGVILEECKDFHSSTAENVKKIMFMAIMDCKNGLTL